jgi:hypothetical protein
LELINEEIRISLGCSMVSFHLNNKKEEEGKTFEELNISPFGLMRKSSLLSIQVTCLVN